MPELMDPYGRRIEYLRLSVTDRCDFRCIYCIPKGFRNFTPARTRLTLDEIVRLVRIFSEIGIRKVRLTGGEPLVRKDLVEMACRLGVLSGVNDLSLSTNASQLAGSASELKSAGIKRVNVSLDSLETNRFHRITRGDLSRVMAGLMAAKEVNFNPIKINMVVMKGVNDHEVGEMVRFCLEHGFTLRFIETMPVGDAGRRAANHYLDLDNVRKKLEKVYDLEPAVMPAGGGPAKYVRVKGTDLRIGFITPMSQHFCEKCNRIRLSVEGTLYLCLGQHDRLELRPMLRAGADDQDLKQAIFAAIERKPQRHEFNERPEQIIRVMSLTGG